MGYPHKDAGGSFFLLGEKMERIEIKTLTPEEIETLQVDAALRLIGENTVLLTRVNRQIGEAIVARGRADMELQQVKNDKSTLVELLRALKVICERA